MNINLRIDKIVLDGVPLSPSQRETLREAIEQELVSLATQAGSSVGILESRTERRISGERITLRNNDPHSAGTNIARSIYSALSTPRGEAPARQATESQERHEPSSSV